MKRIQKSFFINYLLTAIAFVLLGVVFLVFPGTSSRIICYIFGGFLCILGLIRVINYFMTPISINEYHLGFVIGFIAIGAGIYFFVHPEFLSGALPIVFGIVILLDSLVKLQNMFDMLRLHDRKWLITLIMTLVTAALGTTLLINPFKVAEALLLCLGISLVANGIIDAAAILLFYFLIKETHDIPVPYPEEDELD